MTTSEMFGLAGKVAVVTGGSRGIGRAIAAGFAEAGADVVIASRKLGNCTAAATEISASTGRTARLMVLHIAYKMEHGLDISQENSIAKNFIADMLSSVVDTALQIHGALGYTLDTPLAAWYAEVRMQHLVDGPDEVHRWRIGRNVLAAQRKSGTTAAAAGGDLF